MTSVRNRPPIAMTEMVGKVTGARRNRCLPVHPLRTEHQWTRLDCFFQVDDGGVGKRNFVTRSQSYADTSEIIKAVCPRGMSGADASVGGGRFRKSINRNTQ